MWVACPVNLLPDLLRPLRAQLQPWVTAWPCPDGRVLRPHVPRPLGTCATCRLGSAGPGPRRPPFLSGWPELAVRALVSPVRGGQSWRSRGSRRSGHRLEGGEKQGQDPGAGGEGHPCASRLNSKARVPVCLSPVLSARSASFTVGALSEGLSSLLPVPGTPLHTF